MMQQLVELPLRHNQADVLRYLGFLPGKTKLTEEIQRLLEYCRQSFRETVHPRGVFCTGQLDEFALTATASGFWGSHDLEQLLNTAKKASLLAVTLGPALDEQITRLFASGDYAQAAIWDALGSDAAEQAMESLYEIVGQMACQQGFILTRRFSPGYGDLALQHQHRLHRFVAGSTIGLAVTEKCLLVPRKSVTAIAGWLIAESNQNAGEPSSACITCRLPHCQFRRPRASEEDMHETQ